jgi:hypothetical protein
MAGPVPAISIAKAVPLDRDARDKLTGMAEQGYRL